MLFQNYVFKITFLPIDSVLTHSMDIEHLKLPESFSCHTQLLELQPLDVTVLNNPAYESLYKFSHFNPVQTQIFHCLYHTDNNVLLGAPTGSGKTIAAEICVFRLFNKQPAMKVNKCPNVDCLYCRSFIVKCFNFRLCILHR